MNGRINIDMLRTKRPSFAAVSVANQYEVGHANDALDQLTHCVGLTESTCSGQFRSFIAVNKALVLNLVFFVLKFDYLARPASRKRFLLTTDKKKKTLNFFLQPVSGNFHNVNI